jgi:hypothetical protein
LAFPRTWGKIGPSRKEDPELLAKSNRAFKSAKRNKELARIQKREKKLLKRQSKHDAPSEDADVQVESPLEEENPGTDPENPDSLE